MPRSHIEGQILRKFERSLKKAIERHEEYGWEDIDSIARQKLLVQAIRHFGLGDYVTIQWFKDGDVLTELDNHDTEVDITNAGVNEGPIPDEEDIISYFKNGTSEMPLDAILGVDDRKEWLKSYYHFHEEIPFEQIYLNGMQIHLHIREIAKYCAINADIDEFPDNIVRTVDQACTNLKQKLNKYPLFRNVPPYVTEFNRAATTILTEFESELSKQDLQPSIFTSIFYQLNTFYYETVWDVISNRIGFYTANRPNEESVRKYRKGSLKVSKETFSVELDKLRNECNNHNIYINPQIDRLPDLEDEYEGLDELLEWEKSDSVDQNVVSG